MLSEERLPRDLPTQIQFYSLDKGEKSQGSESFESPPFSAGLSPALRKEPKP